jgi:hypothetical protein
MVEPTLAREDSTAKASRRLTWRALWIGPMLPPAARWLPARWVTWLWVAVSVAMHVIVAKDSKAVSFDRDEVGNLFNGIYVAQGAVPTELYGSAYMPGLGVLLSPLWLVQSDPIWTYRAAIVIVTMLGIATIWPFARLAREWGATPRASLVIASVISLAPARILHTNNVLAEHLLVLCLAWLAALTFTLLRKRTVGAGLAFGAVAGATLWSHGRALPVVGVALIGLVVLAIRSPRAGVAGLAVMVPLCLAGVKVLRDITAAFYPFDQREQKLVSELFDNTPVDIIDALASQLWYVLAAWSVLVIAGVVALLARMGWARARHTSADPQGDADRIAARWIGLGLAAGAGHAVLLLAGTEPAHLRLDIHVYGRYIDAYAPIVAVMGLVVLTRGMTRKLALVVSAYTVVTVTLFHFVTEPRIPTGGYWTSVHLYGIAYMMNPANIATEIRDPWWAITLLAVVLAAAITLAAWRGRVVLLAVVAGYFVFAALATDQGKLAEHEAGRRYIPLQATMVRSLPGPPPSAGDNAVDVVGLNMNRFAYYSYPAPWSSFTESQAPRPIGDVLISSKDSQAAIDGGAWPLNGSLTGEVLVWVYPGELRDELDAQGRMARPVEE